MKDVITYKNYIASIHFSADDEVFFGRIEGINDLVNFEGQNVAELKAAFTEAVENYIKICQLNGKPSIPAQYKVSPDRLYSLNAVLINLTSQPFRQKQVGFF